MTLKRMSLIGITGRMGGEILSLSRDLGFEVTGGVANTSDDRLEGVKIFSAPQRLDPASMDVVVDFSLPELTKSVVSWCEANGKPLVCGVTGIDESTRELMAKAGQQIPILWAPNMSLGVAVVSRMLSTLSALEGFEFQIEELHHKRKKDKPSGTALFLQDKLEAAVNTELPEPLAIRGGGIFGIHRIWAMGEEEMVTIEHTAMNRRVFARGALRAAGWILGQKPGLYRMDDLL